MQSKGSFHKAKMIQKLHSTITHKILTLYALTLKTHCTIEKASQLKKKIATLLTNQFYLVHLSP